MKWTDYDSKKINVVQQKTGQRVWLHCPAPFKEMLDKMSRYGEYIFNSKWKRPYKHAGTLGAAIRNHVEKRLNHSDYSMHGLRKNAGMELALAGCNVPEIMAVLGHKSPKMAIFYVQQADKISLARPRQRSGKRTFRPAMPSAPLNVGQRSSGSSDRVNNARTVLPICRLPHANRCGKLVKATCGKSLKTLNTRNCCRIATNPRRILRATCRNPQPPVGGQNRREISPVEVRTWSLPCASRRCDRLGYRGP